MRAITLLVATAALFASTLVDVSGNSTASAAPGQRGAAPTAARSGKAGDGARAESGRRVRPRRSSKGDLRRRAAAGKTSDLRAGSGSTQGRVSDPYAVKPEIDPASGRAINQPEIEAAARALMAEKPTDRQSGQRHFQKLLSLARHTSFRDDVIRAAFESAMRTGHRNAFHLEFVGREDRMPKDVYRKLYGHNRRSQASERAWSVVTWPIYALLALAAGE